ncbi:MAG TPA: MOSC domain-containing protein, partial [Streptomyces sp.]|nr:MOSC domain-containing protein [Streptomyces sp.]
RAGDPVEIVHRPDHDVTVALQFRAVTTERTLLPRLLAAGGALHSEALEMAQKYGEKYGV